MTDIRITDDQELSDRLEGYANGMLALADFVTADPLEQASALITAATIVIEREVGRDMAGAALSALIEPTMNSWASRPAHSGLQ